MIYLKYYTQQTLHFMQMHSHRLRKFIYKVNYILKTPTNLALVQDNKRFFGKEHSSQLVHILQQLGDPWHHHLAPHHCLQDPGSWCGHLPLLLQMLCRMEQQVTTTRTKVWLTSCITTCFHHSEEALNNTSHPAQLVVIPHLIGRT